MRFKNFLSGFTVASMTAICFISISFWQDWIVTSYQAERKAMASLAFAGIAYERQLYDGVIHSNGCYIFPNDRHERIQQLVREYSLTSDDLIYSIDSLLCKGGIMPANT